MLGIQFLLHGRAADIKTHTLVHTQYYQHILLVANPCTWDLEEWKRLFQTLRNQSFLSQHNFHPSLLVSSSQIFCLVLVSSAGQRSYLQFFGRHSRSPSCLQFPWTCEMFQEGLNLTFWSLAPSAHLTEFQGKDFDRRSVLKTGSAATPVSRSLPETSTSIDLYVQRHS